MKVLIIGYGSIGQRHARNLSDLGIELVICETNETRRLQAIHDIPQARVFGWTEENSQIGAAIICIPPKDHIPALKVCVERGWHTFIEKPIGTKKSDIPAIQGLLSGAEDRGLVVQCGYQLRYHRGVQELALHVRRWNSVGNIHGFRAIFGQRLEDWVPDRDYRDTYLKHTGIILDSSHEINYLQMIFGKVQEVFCNWDQVSSLQLAPGVEDTADIMLRMESGVVGTVHLNMTWRDYKRGCTIWGEKGEILWKYPYTDVVGGKDYPCQCSANEPYVLEIDDFLQKIYGGKADVSSAEDALETLKVCVAAKKSGDEGRWVAVQC